jgi:4-diphosphocytidyl-2C-methyl-D-erythritol kinase
MMNRTLVHLDFGTAEEPLDSLQRQLQLIVKANAFIQENHDRLRQTVISHLDGDEDAPFEIPGDIESIVYQKLDVIKDPYGSSQQIGSAHFIMTGSSSAMIEVTESAVSSSQQSHR